MKKRILMILLVIVMMFSFALMACGEGTDNKDKGSGNNTEQGDNNNDDDDDDDNGGNNGGGDEDTSIDFTIDDDSNVPVPTYTESFMQEVEDLILEIIEEFDEEEEFTDEDREELHDGLRNHVFPLCARAKISESNLRLILDYFSDNKQDLIDIIYTVSGDEMPDDLEAFYRGYMALYTGAIEVLNADDVAKIVYEIITDPEIARYDGDEIKIITEIGRDNFIIVSRILFKIWDLQLQNQEDMIELVLNLFTNTSFMEDEDIEFEDVPLQEMVELYLMSIQLSYETYHSLTDKELEKLVDIGVDTYAVMSKYLAEAELTSSDKAELKANTLKAIADFDAFYTLLYKATLRVDAEELASEIFELVEEIADDESDEATPVFAYMSYYILEYVYDTFNEDLTAAERAHITNIFKEVLNDMQYYEVLQEEFLETYISWFDVDYDSNYVWVELGRVYEMQVVKKDTLQFEIDEEYLDDPILLIDALIDCLNEFIDEGEVSDVNEERVDAFVEHGNEFMAALLGRYGIPLISGDTKYEGQYMTFAEFDALYLEIYGELYFD